MRRWARVHDCMLTGAVAFKALHRGPAVFGEVGDGGAALETCSFLSEEGHSIVKEFVPEGSTPFKGMGFVMLRAVLVRVVVGCGKISFVH